MKEIPRLIIKVYEKLKEQIYILSDSRIFESTTDFYEYEQFHKDTLFIFELICKEYKLNFEEYKQELEEYKNEIRKQNSDIYITR